MIPRAVGRGTRYRPHMHRDTRQAWIVGLVAFAVLLPGAFFGLPNKPMAGAERVLQGEVIYRDFWTLYAPGSYYSIAALLAVFGKQVLVQAIAGLVLRAAAVGAFFALLRELGGSRRLGAGLALVLTLALWEITPELGTYPGVLPAGLGSLLLGARFINGKGGPSSLLAAGLMLGLGATFKHDVAAYFALATCVGMLASGRPLSERIGACARLLVGALAVAGPVILLLAWKAGPEAWHDLVVFPATDFRIVRSERYPGLLPDLRAVRAWMAAPGELALARDAAVDGARWLRGNGPQLAWLGALVFLARRRAELEREAFAGLLLGLTALPFFWLAAHVQQNTHMLSMALMSFVMGTIAWTRVPAWRGFCVVVLAALAPAVVLPSALEAWLPLRVWSGWARVDLPGCAGVWVSPREAEYYERMAEFVDDNVPPGEAIHAGVRRNDSIIVSNARINYLMRRPAATRYQELHPGVTDREPVQREMIEDLERAGVRCMILWRFGQSDAAAAAVVARRKARIPDAGSTLLDEWVAEHFDLALSVDEYDILWRRDAGEPVLR